MGFNKVLLLLNDADHEVTNDPKGWWERCRNAFHMLSRKNAHPETYVKEPESFGHGCHANGWEAVWEAHADATGVLMVGGNCATVLGMSYNGGVHHTEEAQIKILKEILDRMGYRIVRKSNRKADSRSQAS